jgi:hypothetical protein
VISARYCAARMWLDLALRLPELLSDEADAEQSNMRRELLPVHSNIVICQRQVKAASILGLPLDVREQ